MSNARNLADLLAPGENTLQTVAIETDRIILNGTDGSATNAGDDLLLDASAASTDVGERFTYEDATDDGSATLININTITTDTITAVNTITTDTVTASTIESTGGGVVTLTKQAAAKAFHGHGDQAEGAFKATSETLNISTYGDEATGRSQLNMTTHMSTAAGYMLIGSTHEYTYGCLARSASQYEVGAVNSSGNYADGHTHGVVMGTLA